MQFRSINSNSITASVIGMGTAAFGDVNSSERPDEKNNIRAIHAAMDNGINLIDTAPSYGWGHAEKVVGKAIRDRRDKVIIATKCGVWWQDQRGSYNGIKDGRENYVSLRPDTITIEVETSLKRLGIDRIDLLQCHKPAIPPQQTPIAETMGCLMDLKQQGKIGAIGVSNVSIQQLEEYFNNGDLASNQLRYSMLSREPEAEILPFCSQNSISTLTYWSLEAGLLTGKLGPNHVFAKDDFRGSASDWLPWFRAENRARLKNMFAGWEDLIEKYQCGIAEIALAWTTAKPGVTHTLCGIRTVKQAMQNARAGSIVLEEQDIKRLNNDIKKLGSP